jgi:hypothetical protein
LAEAGGEAYHPLVPSWAPPLVALAVLAVIVAVGAVAQRYLHTPESWDADFRRKLSRWDGLVPVWVQEEARSRRMP